MTVNSGDILRVTAKMKMSGKDVQNTFHIEAQDTNDLDDATVVAAVEARLEAAYDNLLTELSDNLAFDSIVIKNVTQDVPISDSGWPTLTTGNTATGDAPPAVAGMVKFPTGVARSQGRKFIGGLVNAVITTAGDPSSALQVSLANYVVDLLDTWLIGDGEFAFGNYDDVLLRFAEWASGLVVDTFKTQRRRYTGSGT